MVGPLLVLVVAGFAIWKLTGTPVLIQPVQWYCVECEGEVLKLQATSEFAAMETARTMFLSETFLTREQLGCMSCECLGPATELPA